MINTSSISGSETVFREDKEVKFYLVITASPLFASYPRNEFKDSRDVEAQLLLEVGLQGVSQKMDFQEHCLQAHLSEYQFCEARFTKVTQRHLTAAKTPPNPSPASHP